ncbi:TetR family transcriptional regulator [Amycolatopsis mediterranei S699]|uniref:TetR family transcriptional regulator n=2 Tax=Amycolatopsis mediterranei TaxID=33910 RepID=A0A0H3D6P3_AMYMU|nr:TetR/AcrR family transcriptional regulator [Amycolatopsis mediterranei]ADJ46266.1 TetR family transcriptional regulator [Amycolatopsis mediterranei U32]AEK43059.1 TetR family transcriptional regulator [Amycolatopsis mediterranei S699]AFO77977.1 TetR family transcriptional regulator [Amycolatopsis mediterranei S699]AGT85105.1 TetR family transcriptional regulator [Amycolatopsis mediterranei RB]KDO05203.1 TetR family transcriptional regulator [Amycolatopsis mediterranei]
MTSVDVDTRPFRRRLLDGLAESIIEAGFRDTTVADVVRRARTSRRTFYEHFSSREECLIALLAEANRSMIQRISEAVDPRAPWKDQARQAIETWIACAESEPAITLSWIRDIPALGAPARELQRDAMEGFIAMTQRLTDTPEMRAAGISPPSRQLSIMLLGGLRELIATTVEDGGRAGDVTEVAVRASIALLGPA